MAEKIIHEGRNIRRIREILGIKQDALAFDLGISQQAISLLEQKEKVDEKILGDVAKVLKVPVEAIKNMNDDATANFINTFSDNSVNHGPLGNFQCTFNPFDKIVELYESKIQLYERMLKEKDELIEKLSRK